MLAIGALAFPGCASVSFVRNPGTELSTEAAYTASAPFFFLGLVGGPQELYADRICLERGVDQIETVYSAQNFLSTLFTVGVYSPRTVRVWCSL